MRGKLFLRLLQFLNGHLAVIDALLVLATAPRLFHVFLSTAGQFQPPSAATRLTERGKT
jgi:hypothetical protein